MYAVVYVLPAAEILTFPCFVIHIVKTNMVNILLRYFCFKILSLFTFANYIEKLRLKWLKICKLLVIRNII